MEFIHNLVQSQQFSTVHFIGHSMGCRVLCQISKLLPSLFRTQSRDGMKGVQVGSITLMNPEADLSGFVQRFYFEMRKVTSLVTIYADEEDGALKPAEVFSRQKMLGLYAMKGMV